MTNMRVYELAREMRVESKRVLEYTERHAMGRKTASSTLDEVQVELIRCAFAEVEPTEELSHGRMASSARLSDSRNR